MGKYGGTTTIVKLLEVGTKFYVHNGAWSGEIVLKDGVKCVLIDGDELENAHPILDDSTLDISIEGECKHNKAYDDYILTSNPPKFPWICSECGETGIDQQLVKDKPSYDELLRKFNLK